MVAQLLVASAYLRFMAGSVSLRLGRRRAGVGCVRQPVAGLTRSGPGRWRARGRAGGEPAWRSTLLLAIVPSS